MGAIRYSLFLWSLLFVIHFTQAQNTVGLLSQRIDEVYEGYNLVFPHNQSIVFLIDNCGQIVHTWVDDGTFRPGNSVYLLENGDLVKCKRHFAILNDSIWAGGGGETVEIRSWENEMLTSFTLNNDSARLHHDVAPLPNGNILMIAWELKSEEEAIEAGRDPATLAQGKLWPDYILEWNPTLDSIVWEWHAWDHLIQDFDPTKDNFGIVSEHPERIDINFDTHAGHPDWLHANSIDYNPTLDQILLSVPYFHEVWIIDHNSTTEEAKGEKGDLLYRWGNPQAYDAGEEDDQQLFFPHDIHWIHPDAVAADSAFGKLALFNNRVGIDYSTGNILSTFPDPSSGTYTLMSNTFGPGDFDQTILYPGDSTRFFSNSLSSSQVLPNGNVLMLAGRWGQAVEISPNNDVVWEYIIPLRGGSPVTQGTELSINNNITFRMERYPLDFPGFQGRELSPLGYWELDANEEACFQTVSTSEKLYPSYSLYPNPSQGRVNIVLPTIGRYTYKVRDLEGRKILESEVFSSEFSIDMAPFMTGMYWLEIEGFQGKAFIVAE